MKIKRKHITALATVIVPFYFPAILQRLLLSQEQVLVEEFLGYYMLLGIVGITVILLTNKYVLGNALDVFRNKSSKWIVEVALAGILMGTFYLLRALEEISYGAWLSSESESPVMAGLLTRIFDSTLFGLLIIGPFTWLNEAFFSLSVAFILIVFWSFSDSKQWIRLSITLTAALMALLQLDNGLPEMINSFVLMMVFGFMFHRYRSLMPLLIMSILFQVIDLASFWFYG